MDDKDKTDVEPTWAELKALAGQIETRLIALNGRVDRLEEIERSRDG